MDSQAHKEDKGQTHHTVNSKEQKPKKPWQKYALPIFLILGIVGLGGGFWYYEDQQQYVYADTASVTAPLIQLTPTIGGVFKEVFVKENDFLRAHEPVARVGDEMITTEIPGIAINVQQDIGAIYSPTQPVVTEIDPSQLRVVVDIAEDKGLNDVHVGQRAFFTLDAFGSQKFDGYVEAVKETDTSGDVVFNISDQRQEQQFEVKINYDHNKYPFFQNGMSAKVWIVKNSQVASQS